LQFEIPVNSAPFHQKLTPPSLMRALVSPSSKDSRLDPPRFSNSAIQPELPLNIDWSGLLLNFQLITVKEAATELKCSDQQIRNFIEEMKLLAFHINVEEAPRRTDYRIVRKTAAGAFTFQTHQQRAALAAATIKTVNDWLFAPFDPKIGAWQPALRMGARSVLTVDESAQALRCTGEHIRQLYNADFLRALDIGAQSSALSPQSSPLHLRIVRESLVAFVAIRLARQNNIDLKTL
jgi:hypothetical protein